MVMNELDKEILRLEEELTQTEMRLDAGALDRIYADDIMVTAPIGICVDKAAVMTEVREAAKKAVVGRYDKDDLKVRAYGDTAVTSYRMTAEAEFEGVEIKRHLCITNVWMKRNGDWQIVARHTAGLPDDSPPDAGAHELRSPTWVPSFDR
jgi:ketosteroid isomerase-like protein